MRRPSSYPYPYKFKDIGDATKYAEEMYKHLLDNDRRGEGAGATTTDPDLKELIVRPEWHGAKGDGVANDSAAVQAAVDAAESSRLMVVFGNKTYKLNTGITQQSDICVDLGRSTLDFSGLASGSAWTITPGIVPVYSLKTVLRGGYLKGVATPADGVYNASVDGITITANCINIEGVYLAGFGDAFTFGENAYVVTLNGCSVFYSLLAWDSDQTGYSSMGAALYANNCLFAHNDQCVYNKLCEANFYECSFDTAIDGFVKDNITSDGGYYNGKMYFYLCRFENGGAVGTPWIKNSGMMTFRDCNWYENLVSTYIFNNVSGLINIHGGLTRLKGQNYLATGDGIGRIYSDKVALLAQSEDNFRLTAEASGIHNSDIETGDVSGWIVTVGGDDHLTVDAADPHGGDYCLSLVGGDLTGNKFESLAIMIAPGAKYLVFSYFIQNPNVANVYPHIDFYAADGKLLEYGVYYNILNAVETTTDWTYEKMTPEIPIGCAYYKFSLQVGLDQAAAILLDDFYQNQW